VRRWVGEQGRGLGEADRAALLQYAAECATWEESFYAARSRWGDPRDYTTRPAANVRLNPYEHRLGAALAAAGLPVEAQAGVSKDGGSRRGGWFGSYWLDFAHRDRAHMLLLDVELDGRHTSSRHWGSPEMLVKQDRRWGQYASAVMAVE
jgi:hypothetical protein